MPVAKQGDTNPLMEEALKIGDLPSTEDKAPEEPAKQRLAEPKTGSYETFLATFRRAM